MDKKQRRKRKTERLATAQSMAKPRYPISFELVDVSGGGHPKMLRKIKSCSGSGYLARIVFLDCICHLIPLSFGASNPFRKSVALREAGL